MLTDPLTAPVVVPDPAPPAEWRTSLTGEYASLATEKSLESFKGSTWQEVGPQVAKAFVETKKMVGMKAAVPGADAKPEEIAAFYKALGVPESPDKYPITPHPVMAHPGWNQQTQAEFLKLAHANGTPPKTVQAFLDFYANSVAKDLEAVKGLEAEARTTLRQEWGPNYEPYLGAANRGLSRVEQAIGAPPGALAEAVKGTDPLVVAKAFHWMESQFVEHGFVQAEPIGGVSAEEASSRISAKFAELKTVPEGSDRAKAIINEIAVLGKIKARAA